MGSNVSSPRSNNTTPKNSSPLSKLPKIRPFSGKSTLNDPKDEISLLNSPRRLWESRKRKRPQNQDPEKNDPQREDKPTGDGIISPQTPSSDANNLKIPSVQGARKASLESAESISPVHPSVRNLRPSPPKQKKHPSSLRRRSVTSSELAALDILPIDSLWRYMHALSVPVDDTPLHSYTCIVLIVQYQDLKKVQGLLEALHKKCKAQIYKILPHRNRIILYWNVSHSHRNLLLFSGSQLHCLWKHRNLYDCAALGLGILHQMKLNSWNETILTGEVMEQAEDILPLLKKLGNSQPKKEASPTKSSLDGGNIGMSSEFVDAVRESKIVQEMETEMLFDSSNHLITHLKTKVKQRSKSRKNSTSDLPENVSMASLSGLDEQIIDTDTDYTQQTNQQLHSFVSPFIHECVQYCSNLNTNQLVRSPAEYLSSSTSHTQMCIVLRNIFLSFHDEARLVSSELPLLSQMMKEVQDIVQAFGGTIPSVTIEDSTNFVIRASFGVAPSTQRYNAQVRALSAAKLVLSEYQLLVNKLRTLHPGQKKNEDTLLNTSLCCIGLSCAKSKLSCMQLRQQRIFFQDGEGSRSAFQLVGDTDRQSSGVWFDESCFSSTCKYRFMLPAIPCPETEASNSSPSFYMPPDTVRDDLLFHTFANVSNKLEIERALNKRTQESAHLLILSGESTSPTNNLVSWTVRKTVRESSAYLWLQGESLFQHCPLFAFRALLMEVLYCSLPNKEHENGFSQDDIAAVLSHLCPKWSQHAKLLHFFCGGHEQACQFEKISNQTPSTIELLLDLLSDLVVAHSMHTPHSGLLFCICNFEWLDTLSHQLLCLCAKKLSDTNTFFIVTSSTSGDSPQLSELTKQFLDVTTCNIAQNLSPTDDVLLKFCSSLLGGDIRLGEQLTLFLITEPAPSQSLLYIESLVLLLQEKCKIAVSSDRNSFVFIGGTPPMSIFDTSLYQLIGERVESLPQTEKEILYIASAIGTSFNEVRLVDLCSKCSLPYSESSVREGIRSLVKKHLLTYSMESFAEEYLWLHFRHSAIRDAAYDLVPSSLRLTIHQTLFEELHTKQENSYFCLVDLVRHLSCVLCEEEAPSQQLSFLYTQQNCSLAKILTRLRQFDDADNYFQRARFMFENVLVQCTKDSTVSVEDMRELEVELYSCGAWLKYLQHGNCDEYLQLAMQCQDACNLQSASNMEQYVLLSGMISLIDIENSEKTARILARTNEHLLKHHPQNSRLTLLLACRSALLYLLHYECEEKSRQSLDELMSTASLNGTLLLSRESIHPFQLDFVLEFIAYRLVYEYCIGKFKNLETLLDMLMKRLHTLGSKQTTEPSFHAGGENVIFTLCIQTFALQFMKLKTAGMSPNQLRDWIQFLLTDVSMSLNDQWLNVLQILSDIWEMDMNQQSYSQTILLFDSLKNDYQHDHIIKFLLTPLGLLINSKLQQAGCDDEASRNMLMIIECSSNTIFLPLTLLQDASLQYHLVHRRSEKHVQNLGHDSNELRHNFLLHHVSLRFAEAAKRAKEMSLTGLFAITLALWTQFENSHIVDSHSEESLGTSLKQASQSGHLNKWQQQLENSDRSQQQLQHQLSLIDQKLNLFQQKISRVKSRAAPFQAVVHALKLELAHAEAVQKTLVVKKDEKLRLAEEAVHAAQKHLNALSKKDIAELKSIRKPSESMRLVFRALCLLFDLQPHVVKNYKRRSRNSKQYDYFTPVRQILNDNQLFQSFNLEKVSDDKLLQLSNMMKSTKFSKQDIVESSAAVLTIHQWIQMVVQSFEIRQSIASRAEEQRLNRERVNIIKKKLELSNKEHQVFLKDVEKIEQEAQKVRLTRQRLLAEFHSNQKEIQELQHLLNVTQKSKGKTSKLDVILSHDTPKSGGSDQDVRRYLRNEMDRLEGVEGQVPKWEL